MQQQPFRISSPCTWCLIFCCCLKGTGAHCSHSVPCLETLAVLHLFGGQGRGRCD